MKQVAAIALGSNLASVWGDRAATLEEAVKRIGLLGQVKSVSTFHETDPVGYLDQPLFLNGALLLETDCPPETLLTDLLAIEKQMGRDRSHAVAKGPRVVDLDLLLFGEQILRSSDLTLPHPALAERRFVLEPLAEIAPGMWHPVLNASIAELLARLDTTIS
jgi:2-amino-4-hydroxy-6-hydroxymethyldihydropteridine diphosphokinase